MTYQVIIEQIKDSDAESRRREDIKEWWRENLTGTVTAEQSKPITTYRVIDDELVSDLKTHWTFTFSRNEDAIRFKLVFG